jgi:hypothetical protein
MTTSNLSVPAPASRLMAAGRAVNCNNRRHARACPAHPRLWEESKAWVAGFGRPSPAMTTSNLSAPQSDVNTSEARLQ